MLLISISAKLIKFYFFNGLHASGICTIVYTICAGNCTVIITQAATFGFINN